MADILIRGMEMPQENEILVFDMWNGKMYARSTANVGAKSYEVVPLPEGHGRLIDADALFNESCDVVEDHSGLDYIDPCPMWGYSADMIAHAPTIVPAEGEDE